MNVPIGQHPDDRTETSKGPTMLSPFTIVGISILLISLLMFAILPIVGKGSDFKVNFWASVLLLILGLIMTFGGKKRKG